MTAPVSHDFAAKMLELEPFLSSEAKRSLAALRGIMDCFPGQALPEIEKNVRGLLAISACFPGQSPVEAERSIKSLLQNSRTSAAAMAERARALANGRTDESVDAYFKDAKKLDSSDLASIGKSLGFTLSGTKTKMADDLRRWVESCGQAVPLSAKDQALAEGRRLAAPIRALVQNVTPDSVTQILRAVEAAAKEKAEVLQAFAAELGIPVDGSKATMKKQIKDFVSKLSVSHVQTRF